MTDTSDQSPTRGDVAGKGPGIPGVPLKHEARVLRAPLLKNEDNVDGTPFRVAAITDFPNVGFLSTPEREIHVGENLKLAEKYELQPFDVLVTIVGTIGSVAVVPGEFPRRGELYERWVPATNMLVVRFRDDAEKKAIAFAVYMKSRHGREMLAELTHGTTIPLVSKKEFSRQLIPYLSPEVCDQSMTIFYREIEIEKKRRRLQDEIDELRDGFLRDTHLYQLTR
jgi:hypothetical protein